MVLRIGEKVELIDGVVVEIEDIDEYGYHGRKENGRGVIFQRCHVTKNFGKEKKNGVH